MRVSVLRRRPQIDDTVAVRYGDCRVTAVRDHGRTLDVVDRLNRPWTVTRAADGWWTVLRAAGHDLAGIDRIEGGRGWRCECGESGTVAGGGDGTARARHNRHVRQVSRMS